jgi:hypothetical protein
MPQKVSRDHGGFGMKATSDLLINEYPIIVLPSLVKKFGLQEAVVLQQIHFWITLNSRKRDAKPDEDGRFWTYNSYKEWQKQMPFWCESTIKKAILKMEKMGVLLSRQPNVKSWDREKEYTIDYDAMSEIMDAEESIPYQQDKESTFERVNRTPSDSETVSLLNNESEITTEITTSSISQKGRKQIRKKNNVLQSSLIPLEPTEKSIPTSQVMVGILSKVTGLDYKLKTNIGRLAKQAGDLVRAGYAPEFVEREYSTGGWWYSNDWRGKKGQNPTPEQVAQTIGQIKASVETQVGPVSTVYEGGIYV